jgi:hypothetical protein
MKDSRQSKGGRARAEALSDEERRAIARKGAAGRWTLADIDPATIKLRATHSGDRDVGDGLTFPVYNLSDGSRVVSERGFFAIIGAKGRGTTGGHRLAAILNDSIAKAFFPKKLLTDIESPIVFLGFTGRPTFGYKSDLVKEFCIAFAKAKSSGALRTEAQLRYATNCEALMYAFAQAGIDSWIDEATGYQVERARNAIDEIVKRYVAPSYFSWTQTFPNEFFGEIYRLKGWEYDPSTSARPGYVGHLIADVVYSRLAPGVLAELEKKNPTITPGRRKRKHFQWLTKDHGHPKLREHLSNLIFMMGGYQDWPAFYRRLQHAAPRLNETPELDFGDDTREP